MRNECNLLLKKADFHSVERNSPAKGILQMYHENEISNLATRQKLLNLALEKVGPEQSIVAAVESL